MDQKPVYLPDRLFVGIMERKNAARIKLLQSVRAASIHDLDQLAKKVKQALRGGSDRAPRRQNISHLPIG